MQDHMALAGLLGAPLEHTERPVGSVRMEPAPLHRTGAAAAALTTQHPLLPQTMVQARQYHLATRPRGLTRPIPTATTAQGPVVVAMQLEQVLATIPPQREVLVIPLELRRTVPQVLVRMESRAPTLLQVA